MLSLTHIVLSGLPLITLATAVTSHTGTSPRFWREAAVVVYRVERVDSRGRLATAVHGRIVAVVATDSPVPSDLDLTIEVGVETERLRETLAAADTFVLCLLRDQHGRWTLPPDGMLFLPQGGPQAIAGFDDPALMAAVRAVRKVREAVRSGEPVPPPPVAFRRWLFEDQGSGQQPSSAPAGR